jgi:threonine aldolase
MIDLSSDTATKPTPGMREAIATAEVGDEQKREDPTVNRLQEQVANLLGKEAALFLPTGTMCNAIAVKVHTQPGDAILADRRSHILRSESGGAGLLSGVIIDQIAGERGCFTPEAVEAALPPPSVYVAPPRLLCVEQTHNFGGGSIWSFDQLEAVCTTAHTHGLAVHMDGARLMNAVVATGISAHAYSHLCDSVWIDFSKGLGTPMGGVLAGSTEFIERARRYKHMFGGALRQAGIVAAACIYALENHVERLRDDHTNAQRLAEGLSDIPGMQLDGPVESNMVFFDTSATGMSNADFLAGIQAHGVRMGAVAGSIRAVTHLGISAQDVEQAIEVARTVLNNSQGML